MAGPKHDHGPNCDHDHDHDHGHDHHHDHGPRPEPFRHAQPKVGRNDPCPCGSGRKFKKCHGGTPAAAEPAK